MTRRTATGKAGPRAIEMTGGAEHPLASACMVLRRDSASGHYSRVAISDAPSPHSLTIHRPHASVPCATATRRSPDRPPRSTEPVAGRRTVAAAGHLRLATALFLASSIVHPVAAATGDFDGDGRDELLLRHHADAAWAYFDIEHGVGTRREADLNGDGRDDILMRNVLYELARGQVPDLDEAGFVDNVSRHLARGEFLLLIVGDGIREGVENIVDFVQRYGGLHFSLALVEAALYRDTADRVVVQPRCLARTQLHCSPFATAGLRSSRA